MASIKVPQESPSLALSSKDPYSTSAKLSFQFIFARKCPFDGQRIHAQRETTWGGRRSSKASRFQLRSWLEPKPWVVRLVVCECRKGCLLK